MAELKNALRSGDVSVSGSRQFRAFEELLMAHTEFDERPANETLHLAVSTSAAAYLDSRLSLLRQALDQTNSLASPGQIPDAELTNAGLKISPVESNVPREADALRHEVYRLLPHVKITDSPLEVNRWTGFTRYFVHLKTGERCKDPTLLLTAILADATNEIFQTPEQRSK
jgi:hypothetical protein